MCGKRERNVEERVKLEVGGKWGGGEGRKN
jgi:hypothetical protein